MEGRRRYEPMTAREVQSPSVRSKCLRYLTVTQMKLALVIHGNPQKDASLRRALEFARAAIDSGHIIYRVFLYHDAVRIAHPEFQECDQLIDEWKQLANSHDFELTACVSAADRRGVSDARGTVREGFVIVGLGQFADCLLNADRTAIFKP